MRCFYETCVYQLILIVAPCEAADPVVNMQQEAVVAFSESCSESDVGPHAASTVLHKAKLNVLADV